MCDRCSTGLTFFGLAEPQAPMLESYAAALRSGWSPDNLVDVSTTQLQAITRDPAGFLTSLNAQGGTIALPDGTIAPKLPARLFWMWDGDFCGTISLRYQPGTNALPPYVAGHIGYAVVPWKRNHGYASRALKQMLDEARSLGLTEVALTLAPDNVASRTVIERNGGHRAGTWAHPTMTAGTRDRYLISL